MVPGTGPGIGPRTHARTHAQFYGRNMKSEKPTIIL